jgi:DNA-binding transcriptional LysR family regulator
MAALNLDHLRTFAEVVARGSFSAAARRFSLTQPAISLQVQQLERRLGVRLIERVGKRAQATAAGRTLLAHIGPIDAALADAMAAVQGHRRQVLGRVRLGTGATACIYLLPPLLRRLRSQHPQIEIVVSTGNTPDILRGVESNELDVALVTLPAPGRAFAITPVIQDELVAIFPAGTRPATAITPNVLVQLPVVLYEPGGHARRLIDDWFLRAGLSSKPVMELGSVEAIKKLVSAGLGCGVLPRLALRNSRAERLVVRSLSPALHRQLGIVIRRDKRPDSSLRAMLRQLEGLARSRTVRRSA